MVEVALHRAVVEEHLDEIGGTPHWNPEQTEEMVDGLSKDLDVIE